MDISNTASTSPSPKLDTFATDYKKEAVMWGTIIHLSQLMNFLFPFAGTIIPIIIWMMKGQRIPIVACHGRAIINFQICYFIYGGITGVFGFLAGAVFGSGILAILMIPFYVIAILTSIFVIIGAIKAYDEVVWDYPLTFNILPSPSNYYD